MLRPALIGVAGPELSAEEAALLRWLAPAGVILFRRNIVDPPQLARLVADLRANLPVGALLMLDQEGGRVARLRPPHWRAHPPAAMIGALARRDRAAGERAAWLHGALIGAECACAGFDIVTAPVLDLHYPGAHAVIGDRAFGADPALVAALGRAMAQGLLQAGVQPVAKHAPGHGRARADSHLELPVVAASAAELAADIAPFRDLADLPWMMTAHVCYPAWDSSAPATLSGWVIRHVIRGAIGFAGLLVSDDLAMAALRGSPGARAAAALAAGCDLVLYCSGVLAESDDALAACPPLSDANLERLRQAANLVAGARLDADPAMLAAERAELIG